MTTLTLEPTTIDTVQDIDQAIDYVNANLAAIGSAARLQNPLALDVQQRFAMFCQRRDDVAANWLVDAVERWQVYRADNPQAEL